MEAANRGASDAGGRTIGLNIGLPHEQRPNPYVTRELCFEFHYFFMRKLWFAHLARAAGGLPRRLRDARRADARCSRSSQTRKLDRRIVILLYGSGYWNEIIDFDALVRHGMIAREDLGLFQFADDPATALRRPAAGAGRGARGHHAGLRALGHAGPARRPEGALP